MSDSDDEIVRGAFTLTGAAIGFVVLGHVLARLSPSVGSAGSASSDVHLVTGGRYAATIDLSPPLSWAASPERVQAQAEKMGFKSVTVTKTRPRWFPAGPDGDYYVIGTYARETAKVGRNHAGGQVRFVDVHQLS